MASKQTAGGDLAQSATAGGERTDELHHGVVVADDLEPRRVVAAVLTDLLVHLPLVLCAHTGDCIRTRVVSQREEHHRPVAAWGSWCAS